MLSIRTRTIMEVVDSAVPSDCSQMLPVALIIYVQTGYSSAAPTDVVGGFFPPTSILMNVHIWRHFKLYTFIIIQNLKRITQCASTKSKLESLLNIAIK